VTPDCNGNQIPDRCDIADMTSLDCDANNVPDECQPDCNDNGIADSCDIADLTSLDCNGNIVPDECDLVSGRSGDADGDADIDLFDFSGLQSNFGFGVGPPRIDRFWPLPGEWVVDDIGLTHIEVGFTEPVVVPREAIIVWPLSAGLGDTRIENFTLDYDDASCLLTILFDPPLRDDRVTLVLDYLIEDLSGRPLDGEIFDPYEAVLPSGDGYNGGQAVFRINVLQGDANRDGTVDSDDAQILLRLAEPNKRSRAPDAPKQGFPATAVSL